MVSVRKKGQIMLLLSRNSFLGGLLLGAVVILSAAPILRAVETSPAASEPTPEPPKTFTVPNGTPEKLLAFIERVRTLRPSESGVDAVREFNRKQIGAINEAADKILAAKLTESQFYKAVDWKISALLALRNLGDADAAKKLRAFPLALAKAGYPRIAHQVTGFLLSDQLQQAMAIGGKQLERFVGDVKKFLHEGPIGRDEVGLVLEVTQALEYRGNADLAAGAYRSFGKLLVGNNDPKIASIGVKMNGAARRVGLLGKPMPLEGTFLNGMALNWGADRTKVVLVQFWATWCRPCLEEMDNILRNYELYHDRGFEVLGVNCDDDRSQLVAFLKANPLPWNHLFSEDPNALGLDNPIATYYGVMGIPTLILVGPDGKVVSLAARGRRLGKHLEKLLGPVPKQPAAKSAAKSAAGRGQ